MRRLLAASVVLLSFSCAQLGALQKGAQERSREQLRADFKAAVDEFEANLGPGGAPDSPGLVALAAQLLEAYGVARTYSGTPGDLVITLQPSLDTALNRLALQLRDTVKGTVVYDVGHFLQHPNSPAQFDPVTNTLRLPHAAIADLNADEPSVLHERVHVRTWATIRSGWPTPYAGTLRGGAFGEGGLSLDEMNAYADDVRYAATELSQLLANELEPASVIARSELGAILQARVAGEPYTASMSRLERVWDRLVTRIIGGGMATYPAAEVLGIVARAAADPSRVRYEQTPDRPRAVVRAEVNRGEGPSSFTAELYLPSSAGPADPKNPQLLARQAASALQASKERAVQFTRAMAAVRAVVTEISPGRKVELLMRPQAMAGDE